MRSASPMRQVGSFMRLLSFEFEWPESRGRAGGSQIKGVHKSELRDGLSVDDLWRADKSIMTLSLESSTPPTRGCAARCNAPKNCLSRAQVEANHFNVTHNKQDYLHNEKEEFRSICKASPMRQVGSSTCLLAIGFEWPEPLLLTCTKTLQIRPRVLRA